MRVLEGSHRVNFLDETFLKLRVPNHFLLRQALDGVKD